MRTGGYDESSATTPAYALVIKPLENVSVYANYIEALEAGTVVGSAICRTRVLATLSHYAARNGREGRLGTDHDHG